MKSRFVFRWSAPLYVLGLLACASVPVDEYGEPRWDAAFRIEAFDQLPDLRGLARQHYPVSNEARLDLFQDEIRGLGGGYVGVGTDQNFCLVALAHSEYAWLMDFDPVVVAINKIHLFFIEISPDYGDFKNHWHPSEKENSFTLVEDRFGQHPDFALFREAFDVVFSGEESRVWTRLEQLEAMSAEWGFDSIAANPRHYAYVRQMVLSRRIQAVPGDLRGEVTLRAIGQSARALGQSIRIFYPSNAEEYWPVYDFGFRESVRELPMDGMSIVLRTSARVAILPVFGSPLGEVYSSAPFHYNIQPLENLSGWLGLNRPLNLPGMLRFATPQAPGLSRMTVEPGAWPVY